MSSYVNTRTVVCVLNASDLGLGVGLEVVDSGVDEL